MAKNLSLPLAAGLVGSACQAAPQAAPSGDAAAPVAPASAGSPNDESVESICHMRAGAVAKYAEQNRERQDLPGAPRLAVRILVPPGLDQEELTANLCHAAVTAVIAAGGKLGGVTVFAYRDKNTTGPYTAGKVVYAPYGKWERADPTAPLTAWQMTSEIVTAYLAPEAPIAAGTTVTLTDKDDTTVTMSKVAEQWGDAERLATLPNGTRARVLARKEFSMGASTMIRYEVETVDAGKKRRGWVPGYAVHGVTDSR